MIREFSDPSSEPGVKRTTKKPRRIGDEPPDTGQSPSLSESPPSAMQGIQLSAPDTTAMDQPAPLPSYRDILLGNQLVPPILEDEIPDDDDVELIEGDVLHSTVDDVISIDFSDRVQGMVIKSLDHMNLEPTTCAAKVRGKGKVSTDP
ncbi:hypothetical protein V6N12_009951 [Hibiscus sabdariffa]|uniref:Uncharacterized protein n=1 Tax=Hibiscus sabdariffa TaxID=183260 RepID=A0ABR2EEE8_9ROSI